jgi:hypothetical protein
VDVSIREYRLSDLPACRALQRELVERHREIYGDPGIGGDDPGAGFDLHLRNPELAGLWVALAFFHERGFATLGHLDVFLKLSQPTPREWKDGVTVHGRRYRY